jgi:acylphosphatase
MGARHKAVQLHLSGWVQNTDDGAVEIEAEGEPADIKAFVAWCNEGTILSQVARVQVTPGEPQLYTEFEIR